MRAVAIGLISAAISFAQVQNAADVAADVYTTTLAPGSRGVIAYGSTAGSATVSLLPVNTSTPIPADVVSAGASGIAFVVPSTMPPGPAQLIYKPENQATQWTTVTIVPASLSLYRTGPGGSLVAEVQPASGPAFPNGLSTPAQPGQVVVIWGSGLGATPESEIGITLGGVKQQVLYVGSPSYTPGLDQIDFLLTPGTPDGCYVPLTLTYGTQSVSGFISKTSDGMPCHHPWGLSTTALQMLDGGSYLQTGEIRPATGIEAATASLASRAESAQFLLNQLNAAQISSYFAPVGAAQSCSNTASYSGGFQGFSGGTGFGPMTISNGTSSLMLPWANPTPTDSALNALPPAVIAAGNWTWEAAVPSLSFGFVLPPPVQLAAGAPILINHNQDTTISWNGTGFDSNAVLQLSLTAPGLTGVSCVASAQAGSLTIAPNLLGDFFSGSTGSLTVSVTETGPGIPSADFNYQGQPLLMLVLWTTTDARPVDFQ